MTSLTNTQIFIDNIEKQIRKLTNPVKRIILSKVYPTIVYTEELHLRSAR